MLSMSSWTSENHAMNERMKAVMMLSAVAVVFGVLAGCTKPPAVDPWRADSIPPSTWTTPSWEGVMAAGREPVIRQREMPVTQAMRADDAVAHYPLWWEDPLEDKGDGNGHFAWTWQDYVGMPYSLGRFLLNTMAWPVSAVVTPPGTVLVSDGYIGKDHDAKRGFSPDPAADASDFTVSDAPAADPAGEVPPEEPAPTAGQGFFSTDLAASGP